MNSLQVFLQGMGSRFMVAGFIPALGFVTLSFFVFGPVLPNAITRRLGGTINPLGEAGIVMLLFSIVLGFTLTVLSNFLVKIFEGYIVLDHFPFLRRSELRREGILRRRIYRLKKELALYKKSGRMNDSHAEKISNTLSMLIQQHEGIFPSDRSQVMPTSFGNILKAAEFYSAERYQLDSVTFWPRLVHVIASSYHSRISETRNQLSFMVNCSVLSLLFGMVSWLAALYQVALRILLERNILTPLYFIQINLAPRIYEERAIIYLMIGTVSLIFVFLFYRASLVSVSEFGGMIRSSYDLFRFDLLKALHFKLPEDSRSERELWEEIGQVVMKGYSWDREEPSFIYLHDPHSEDSPLPYNSPVIPPS
jgi:hypothetical protein